MLPRWPLNIPTHCLSLPCGPSPSHEPPDPTGLDWWHQSRVSGERAEMVSWLLASSHPVPMETQPREWRRILIGQMDGGGVCSCVVVVVMRVWPLLRTGAAAAGRREELDKEKKEGVSLGKMSNYKEHFCRIYKQLRSKLFLWLKQHFTEEWLVIFVILPEQKLDSVQPPAYLWL